MCLLVQYEWPFCSGHGFFEPLSETLPSAWLLNGLMARPFQMCFLLLCGQQQPPIEFCQRSFITFLFACEHRCPRSNFTLIFFFFHLDDVLIYCLLLFFFTFFPNTRPERRKKKWNMTSIIFCMMFFWLILQTVTQIFEKYCFQLNLNISLFKAVLLKYRGGPPLGVTVR